MTPNPDNRMSGEKPKERVRLSLDITERESEVLEQLCEEKDLQKVQVIRQALRLYQYVHEASKRGAQVFAEQPGQPKCELIIL